jgi:glycosyltransferase involved in cell wall biosynthesis
LIVVGSGPEEDKISALAKQKKNVHYMGYVPHNSAVKLIRGSDVLIQPSLVEAISSTLLEAMACQIPVIVSRVGGNMELVDDGKTGLLEDPTNIDGFCEKIIKILSDKKMASELARNAKKKAVEFDWMSVGEMYMKLYMQLVK